MAEDDDLREQDRGINLRDLMAAPPAVYGKPERRAPEAEDVGPPTGTMAILDGICGRCGRRITAGRDRIERYTGPLPNRRRTRLNNGSSWAHTFCQPPDRSGDYVVNTRTDPVSRLPWPPFPYGGTMVDWVNRRCRDVGVPTAEVVKLLPRRLPVDVRLIHETVDDAIRTVLARPKRPLPMRESVEG